MAHEEERWFHRIDPDTVSKEIAQVRQGLVAAFERYSSEQLGASNE
jgi:hypothetical protein